MEELQFPLRRGARVEARGEPWQVIDVDVFDRVSLVTLRGVGADNAGETARFLTPIDRISRLDRRHRVRARSRRAVLRTALGAIADATPWTSCWTAGTADIDIRAWQLEPARATLGGATRILLADEVGLGKTIQALLIVSELMARGLARRVLILTPAPLRNQWAVEASHRFRLGGAIFDHEALAALATRLPAGVNPWDTAALIISSIDLAKRVETRQALDAASFDVLIVDEAHHLTPGSDRAALVADLAARTPFVVLATATPHSGDGDAFRFLRQLGGVPPGDDAILVFRRRARDVRGSRGRRVRAVHVPPTVAERRMLEASLAYASAVWCQTGAGHGRLAASVIARRACSSAAAAASTIERRLALLEGTAAADDQPRLPWEDEAADAGVADAILGSPGLADPARERAWLDELRGLAAAASRGPSKLAAVRRLIARTRESVLVFSEYRDVVEWCAAGLADVAPVATLHGGMSSSMRHQAITQFTGGRIRVLVATDAAGEGLNLQARCRLVVNLELPWNPLRLDQRAGRVDRIGQARRVHVRHLVHRGSYEDHVLARLERRRQLAADDLDAAALTEDAVADVVLGGAPLPATRIDTGAAPPTGPSAAHAIEHARRMRGLAGAGTPDSRSTVFARRFPGHARQLIFVFGADCLDQTGRRVQAEVVGIRVELSPSVPRRLSRSVIDEVSRCAKVQSAVREALHERATITAEQLAAVAARLDARLAGIRAAIVRRADDTLVQTSLFDRRDQQRAHARRAVQRGWLTHLDEHTRTVRALGSIVLGSLQLIAAWPDAAHDATRDARCSRRGGRPNDAAHDGSGGSSSDALRCPGVPIT